jgi:hypothetical protein
MRLEEGASLVRRGRSVLARQFGHAKLDISRLDGRLWIEGTACAALSDRCGKKPVQLAAACPQLTKHCIRRTSHRLPGNERSPGIVQARRGFVSRQVRLTMRRAIDEVGD